LKDALRHFDNSVIPGDPGAMDIAGGTGQPIVRRSAVLVALFEEDGETQLVLTRRSFSMREHRGEIALPGGRSDAGETPIDTAHREAREEVGIAETSVRSVGWLSPIVTLALGSAIWPVVGFLEHRPEFVTDPSEVDRAFTVSLAELLAEGAFLEEQWRRELARPGADADGYFPIYFFRVPGDLIWGATARVVTELLCVVTGVEWPEAKRSWP
jgi:8-oxo-dGTP pyrophosphatase MutT (NUDIX family)